jgi:2-polyprenyl-6-hydroxyphenyl methylase/3-demethylubiquinone-9 3-methyltransferase
MVSKNTICLWFNGTAVEAARFYAETFPDSAVGTIHRSPGDYPAGKQGDVLIVEFTVIGIPCIGLNGGPAFKHNEAFSFQVATDDQAETDRLWNAIVSNGGQESACGWCKDKWGLSWQITPRALIAAIALGVVLTYNYQSRKEWAEYFSECGLEEVNWTTQVPLYPPPFSLLVGRGLHFVSLLRKKK